MSRRKISCVAMLLVSLVLVLTFASATPNLRPQSAAAESADPDSHCVPVGGTVMTNFGAIDPNTTMGLATGDLRGAVSGTILGTPEPGEGNTVVFHIQHHWVTESGDTLYFDPATATTVPLSQTVFAIVSYPVHLKGGTGKYAGATGDFTNIGEVNLASGTVFRYSGHVCFASDVKGYTRS